MKTTIYIVLVMVFGIIFLTPRMPNPWPPKNVLEQKESIVFKEEKINQLINKIEHQIKVDSMEIENIKIK